jgi:hypothetical protein
MSNGKAIAAGFAEGRAGQVTVVYCSQAKAMCQCKKRLSCGHSKRRTRSTWWYPGGMCSTALFV